MFHSVISNCLALLVQETIANFKNSDLFVEYNNLINWNIYQLFILQVSRYLLCIPLIYKENAKIFSFCFYFICNIRSKYYPS